MAMIVVDCVLNQQRPTCVYFHTIDFVRKVFSHSSYRVIHQIINLTPSNHFCGRQSRKVVARLTQLPMSIKQRGPSP